MVCKACGGTDFDEQGICLSCGAHNRLPDATPVRVARVTIAPEPLSPPVPASASPPADQATHAPAATPVATAVATPSLLITEPHATDDPAGTNPSSGQFCGRCGSAVDAGNDFCGICGSPLKDEALQRMRAERAQVQRAAVASLTPPVARAHSATHLPRRRAAPSAAIFVLLSLIAAILVGLALGLLIIYHR